jgi:serine protease AprX
VKSRYRFGDDFMSYQNIWGEKPASVWTPSGLNKNSEGLYEVLLEIPRLQRKKALTTVEKRQGQIVRQTRRIPLIEAKVSAEVLYEIAHSRPILKVWDNGPVYALNYPPESGESGFFSGESGDCGSGTVVAVLDTGIYPHNDLTRPENRILAWHDLIGGKESPYDDNGHGTYVAGIIGGNGFSSRGRYCGIASGAKLVGVKVLDYQGVGKLMDLLMGIEWCLDNRKALKIKVINLSLGTKAQGAYFQDPLCRMVTLAWRRGITVCAATQFKSPDGQLLSSPGLNPHSITVGSLNRDQIFCGNDERLNPLKRKANLNPVVYPDLVTSGTAFTSLSGEDGYSAVNGFIASVPLVTGSIALLSQKYPLSSPAKLKRMLLKNVDDAGLGRVLQGAGVFKPEKLYGGKPGNNLPQYPYSPLLKKDLKIVKGNTAPIHRKTQEFARIPAAGSTDGPVNFLVKAVNNFFGWLFSDSDYDADEGVGIQDQTAANPLNLLLREALSFLSRHYDELMPQIKELFGLDSRVTAGENPLDILLRAVVEFVAREPSNPEQIRDLGISLLSRLCKLNTRG